jgi:catechol 2,3-dioxygenase-like lactoylglutathione lyase family enzyme
LVPPGREDTADSGRGPAVGRLCRPGTFAYHLRHDVDLAEEGAMPLTELNHYFIRANNLEETKKFYCDVLGFEVMPRPTFPFPGYWLGVNGKIQVHMGPDGIDNADMYYLGTPKNAVTDHAGVVDHIAFLATEPGNFIRRFKERGMDFQPRSLPEFDLYQIFIKDPNGLTIELNFFGMKDVTDWGGENYSKMPQVASMRA